MLRTTVSKAKGRGRALPWKSDRVTASPVTRKWRDIVGMFMHYGCPVGPAIDFDRSLLILCAFK